MEDISQELWLRKKSLWNAMKKEFKPLFSSLIGCRSSGLPSGVKRIRDAAISISNRITDL